MLITVQVFTGFVGMVTSGGMGQSLIRAKEVDEDDFNAVLTLQLLVGMLVYGVFFLIAPWFAQYFEKPIYEDLLRVSALIFLLRPFVFMRISWLNREMEFKKRSLVGIIAGIFTGISSVLMAWSGMGVWSLTLSGLIGMFCKNILLARFTPLRLRLNFDIGIMRRHSAYGSKIVANDFLSHIRAEAIKLIMSKLVGPSFLGLFNKADSLHRLPYRTFGSPVSQPLFRAMSKIQDDLDQTKYMYYRVVTLLGVYLLPFYVGLWWVAEPFIGVVYGKQWLPAAEPLRILTMAGIFYIVGRPCGVVLMAQNRLTQEMVGQVFNLIFSVVAVFIGLNWGLEGVSWGILASQIFGAFYYYFLVYRTIPTRLTDLLHALIPCLLLNLPLFLILALIDSLTGDLKVVNSALYLVAMVVPGVLVYMAAFLLLPIMALDSEQQRWKQKFRESLSFLTRQRS
ncbi:MAG: lipopolysaccharide biosynthesis protein [Chromatiaceae bacterium]|nr:lipopolysaccharide biosynthesis protein [Chromatiaceae bacterium]